MNSIHLHPSNTGYLPRIVLTGSDDGGTIACWTEWDGDSEGIHRRKLGPNGSTPAKPMASAETVEIPGSPTWAQPLSDGTVLATILEGVKGSIWMWPPGSDERCAPILSLWNDPRDCLGWGAFSAFRRSDGTIRVLAERWRGGGVSACLVDITRGKATIAWESDHPGDCRRPVLIAGNRGDVGAYDCRDLASRRSRIVVVGLPAGDSVEDDKVTLPCPEDADESLPSLVIDDAGTLWISRCRERLADHHGAAIHHSEIVVSSRNAESDWVERHVIDIDYALNPWMAAYWGYRRFSQLRIIDGEGWLFYERKCDVSAMDPSPGKLFALALGDERPMKAPRIVDEGRCAYIIETAPKGRSVRVATKYQTTSFLWHLPWEIRELDIAIDTDTGGDTGGGGGGDGEQAVDMREYDNARAVFYAPDRADSQPESPPVLMPGWPRRSRPVIGSIPTQTWQLPDTKRWNLYFGDPHCHSSYSKDLDGELDELYHFARETGQIDFVCFTDNDCTRYTEPLTPGDWAEIRRAAERFNDPGVFTAFLGWEYTLHRNESWPESRDSHRSMIFPDANGPVYPCYLGQNRTPERLLNRLREPATADVSLEGGSITPSDFPPGSAAPNPPPERILVHHHHPVPIDITDDLFERNVEVWSGWWQRSQRERFWNSVHDALARGLRFGFLGGSDNHERNPGLGGAITGVWAEANTREAIFEALRMRRTFATTGIRPDLRFSVSGIPMGGFGACACSEPPEISIAIEAPTRITSVEILRDGKVIYANRLSDNTFRHCAQDDRVGPGEHWYYARITFEGDDHDLSWNLSPAFGSRAWTSPVWVTVE